jgi:hypothetical protein
MTDTYPELADLLVLLSRQPRPEQPAGKQLTVYGYVRSAVHDPAYGHACADILTCWAVRQGWRLGTVYRDLGVGSSQLIRPGFAALLDVLRLPGSGDVLVIEERHFSRTAAIAKQLQMAVRRTGSQTRVLVNELAAPVSAEDGRRPQ